MNALASGSWPSGTCVNDIEGANYVPHKPTGAFLFFSKPRWAFGGIIGLLFGDLQCH